MCVYVWHWIIHFYGWGHPWCQDKRKRARLNLRPVIFLGDTMDYTLGLNLCFDRKKYHQDLASDCGLDIVNACYGK